MTNRYRTSEMGMERHRLAVQYDPRSA